jgi:hypothetical protein
MKSTNIFDVLEQLSVNHRDEQNQNVYDQLIHMNYNQEILEL